MEPMINTAPIDRIFMMAVQLDLMIGQKEHDGVKNDVMFHIIN